MSPLARYRTPIIIGVAAIAVLVLGYFFLFGGGPKGTFVASGANYVCDSLLTPGPSDTLPPPVPSINPTPTPLTSPSPSAAAASGSTAPSAVASSSASAPASGVASAAPSAPESAAASPPASAPASASGAPTTAPSPTLRLGFTTDILGRNHILNATQTIEYGFCPPDSGDHYNVAGRGPIPAAVYPSSQEQPPGGWIHNLEHGWVVVLYRCKNQSDCPTADEMTQMQAFYNQAPAPNPSQGCDREVLVARFDSMDTRFAVLAWGRELLTDNFDLNTALTFAQQWMDAGSEPEKTIC